MDTEGVPAEADGSTGRPGSDAGSDASAADSSSTHTASSTSIGATETSSAEASTDSGTTDSGTTGSSDPTGASSSTTGDADTGESSSDGAVADPCGPPGSVIYVDADANGANDGSSWADAYTSVHQAMQNAEPSDDVWIAEGSYPALAQSAPVLVLETCVDVYGGFVGTETSIDERPAPLAPTTLQGDFLGDDAAMAFNDNAFQVVVADSVENVTVDGVIATGGRATAGGQFDHGGGLYASNATLALVDVTFVGTVAAMHGGGVYASSSDVTMTGGGILDGQANQEGGGIYASNSTLVLIGATIEGNTAVGGNGGGLRAISSPLTIDTSVFSGNSAAYGGAIRTSGNATITTEITDSTFQDNSASWQGGALYLRNPAVLTGVLLAGNSGTAHGGGIYVETSTLSMYESVVEGNDAQSQGGGVFALASTVDIEDSTFTTNATTAWTAYYYGGGGVFANNTDLTVANCDFESNSSFEGGAIKAAGEGTIAIDNSSFVANSALEDGGALHNGTPGSVNASHFEDNHADASAGGILSSGLGFSTNDSTFISNSAVATGGAAWGGTFNDCVFDGNSANWGGALGGGNVYGSQFSNNTAVEYGGAARSSSASYVDCTFSGNAVTGPSGGGGAVWVSTSAANATFDSCTFTNNSAPTSGGAIFADNIAPRIRNSAFSGNSATIEGGAVHIVDAPPTGLISSSTFYENVAPDGGGIAFASAPTIVHNIVMWGNGDDFGGTSGDATVTYSCTQGFASLGVGNQFGIPNPIVVGPAGELFLDPTSTCVDAGSGPDATADYNALGLNWQTMTTSLTGMLDAAPVDPGVHYVP